MNVARKATAAGFMSLALLGVAAPAQAQPQQRGLVNVIVFNDDVEVLNENAVGVGVAANILANVCGVVVNANVIAQQVVRDNEGLTRDCTAEGTSRAVVTPSA